MFLVNKFLVTNSIENNDIIYSIKPGVSELKEKITVILDLLTKSLEPQDVQ